MNEKELREIVDAVCAELRKEKPRRRKRHPGHVPSIAYGKQPDGYFVGKEIRLRFRLARPKGTERDGWVKVKRAPTRDGGMFSGRLVEGQDVPGWGSVRIRFERGEILGVRTGAK